VGEVYRKGGGWDKIEIGNSQAKELGPPDVWKPQLPSEARVEVHGGLAGLRAPSVFGIFNSLHT